MNVREVYICNSFLPQPWWLWRCHPVTTYKHVGSVHLQKLFTSAMMAVTVVLWQTMNMWEVYICKSSLPQPRWLWLCRPQTNCDHVGSVHLQKLFTSAMMAVTVVLWRTMNMWEVYICKSSLPQPRWLWLCRPQTNCDHVGSVHLQKLFTSAMIAVTLSSPDKLWSCSRCSRVPTRSWRMSMWSCFSSSSFDILKNKQAMQVTKHASATRLFRSKLQILSSPFSRTCTHTKQNQKQTKKNVHGYTPSKPPQTESLKNWALLTWSAKIFSDWSPSKPLRLLHKASKFILWKGTDMLAEVLLSCYHNQTCSHTK